MKFRSIKEFPKCNRVYDFDLIGMREYLEKQNLQFDPIYQRGYVWTQEQKISYVEYFLKIPVSGNHIFLNQSEWDLPLEIVDGKQRLTALFDFLDNKIPAFGYLFSEFEDKFPLHATLRVYVNDLKTQKEVVEWYLSMNTGGSIHTEKDLHPAYDYLNKIV